MMRALNRTLLVGVLASIGVGCGSAKSRVTGTVTYKGQPVKDGSVTFYIEGATPVSATILDGSYEAIDVPVGEALVSVSVPTNVTPQEAKAKKIPLAPGTARPVPPVSGVPDRYGNPASSNLKFTVEKGSNSFPINLTD